MISATLVEAGQTLDCITEIKEISLPFSDARGMLLASLELVNSRVHSLPGPGPTTVASIVQIFRSFF